MSFKTFSEAENYLYQFIFPKESYTYPRLDKIKLLLSYLGNPERKTRFIHIGGTSGKGSTSVLVASILQEAGFKVGLTISPHLQKITERIQINRQLMPDEVFINYVNRLKIFIEKVGKEGQYGLPSFFEIMIAMAFWYFAEEKVDFAVAEVGLGGQWDATNVIDPEVSIVTNVGLDHMGWLGDTVEKIGNEKMRIIKSERPVVTGITQKSVLKMVQDYARELNLPLLVLGKDFGFTKRDNDHFDYFLGEEKIENIGLNLKGDFQFGNAALAITAVKHIKNLNISDEMIRKAFSKVSFSGRLETVNYKGKNLILDGAHNPMKMEALIQALTNIYPERKFRIILGIKSDKDYQKMIRLLEKIALDFALCEFQRVTDIKTTRLSHSTEEMGDFLKEGNNSFEVRSFQSFSETLTNLDSLFQRDDLILVTGSLYLVGEVRDALGLKVV